MANKADGIIVGSAIVKICEKYGENCIPYIEDYVKQIKTSYIVINNFIIIK